MVTKAQAPHAIRSTDTRIFNGDGCPIEWLHDKVIGFEPTPRSYFERGTLGHAMIEAELMGFDPWELFDNFELLPGEWLETSKCTKAGLKDETAAIFERWVDQYVDDPLNLYHDNGNEPWEVSNEVTLECKTPNGTPISTVADAIVWDEDNGPAVVDWKLGTSKSGKAMQLYLYWYCMRKTGLVEDGDIFRGWFHYPTYAKPIVEIGEYPGDLFVEAYVDEAQAGRLFGPYLPNPDWFRCSQCEHKDVCPLWGGDYQDTLDVNITFTE